MSKKATAQFWDTAHRYLGHQLKVIRQVSSHTIDSYRDCLNSFIDYLERVENISRKKISFHDFGKETIKRYQTWMNHGTGTGSENLQSPVNGNPFFFGIRSTGIPVAHAGLYRCVHHCRSQDTKPCD